jgi:putative CocE/NonD family hydrolase
MRRDRSHPAQRLPRALLARVSSARLGIGPRRPDAPASREEVLVTRAFTRLASSAALLILVVPRSLPAQGLEYVKAHYTKYEFRIPMRDGARLFTSVYVPKDSSRTYPILLNRTPYTVAPYGVDQYKSDLGPSSLFGESGYIVAYQDVRGRYMSEGVFADVRPQLTAKQARDPKAIDESTDTFDTIDWMVKNIPNNNGRAGIWGISYPGFYAAAGMINAHPALKAASPQAPLVDWFVGDDVHHNGALFLTQWFDFTAAFGGDRPEPTTKRAERFDYGTPDAYDFFLRLGPVANADRLHFKGQRPFWTEIMRHETYDEYWKARALLPHVREIKPAVLTVGGWFDAEDLYGPLHLYATVEKSDPAGQNMLVMGPWVHGGWARGDGASLGPVSFADKTSAFYREHIEFPFFEYHLKGKGTLDHPEAWMFETGRNQWHRLDAWPPRGAKPESLYLQPGGRLAFEPPGDGASAFDEFTSDPAHPVPYTAKITTRYPGDFMIEDQRFASRRPDVLVYQSEPLDHDVTLAGPIEADLVVSTTGTDSDWVVKLIDVYPGDFPDPDPNPTNAVTGGFQQLVRAEVMRGKFRDSLEKPETFEPGKPTNVAVPLQDVFHTFRPGHRIMVQIQCTWFPLVDRNPQTFVDIYQAKETDFQKADQRVYHEPDRASKLELRVLPTLESPR